MSSDTYWKAQQSGETVSSVNFDKGQYFYLQRTAKAVVIPLSQKLRNQ